MNPNKSFFCVESSKLLGFLVSKESIRLNPLKVEAIVNLPPPSSLLQLQSLQGKSNFLRGVVLNYAELAKGFTQLLKKGIPFLWDEVSQRSFYALKNILINAPLLHPPNYHRDYFMYLVASSSTIAMVLVQDDDDGTEHVIYYLIRDLMDTNTQYAHVDKLVLAVVHAF